MTDVTTTFAGTTSLSVVKDAIVLGGTGTNIENTDPMFVNPTTLDFHLMLGSPAVDAGLTLSIVPTAFDGVVRPLGGGYDIGAFESH